MTYLADLVAFRREDWSTVAYQGGSLVADGHWDTVEVHHVGAGSRGATLGQLRNLEAAMIRSGKYRDVWYQTVIMEDGTVVEGRGIDRSNSPRRSLTVLFMGSYSTVGANDKQLQALRDVWSAVQADNPTADVLLTWHDERAETIGGPRTACCGAALIEQIKDLRMTPPTPPAPAPTATVYPDGVHPVSSPIVDVMADSAGGYAIVLADGGVFTFGGFAFHGSAAPHLTAGDSIVSAAGVPGGYLLVAKSGAVFAFGAARYGGRVAVEAAG